MTKRVEAAYKYQNENLNYHDFEDVDVMECFLAGAEWEDKNSEVKQLMLNVLKVVLDTNRESFRDSMGSGGHTTVNCCIGCGNSYEHDEDCFIPLVELAIEKAEKNV